MAVTSNVSKTADLPAHTTVSQDEWIIKGKVYKLDQEWIDRHPGGSLILNINRGRDCSELFETYHLLSNKSDYISKKLHTYYVRDATKEEIISPFDWDNLDYHKMKDALKQRLCQFIDKVQSKANNCSEGKSKNGDSKVEQKYKLKASTQQLLIYVLLGSLMISCWIYSYTAQFGSVDSYIACVIMGFCGYVFCADVMHCGTHYSLFENSRYNEIFGHIFGSFHCFSWTWYHQHVINHHSYTNIEYLDTDLYWFHDLFFANKNQLNLINNDKLYPKHPYNENLSYSKPNSQSSYLLALKICLSAILSNISPNTTLFPWPYPVWLTKLLRLDFYNNNFVDTKYIQPIRITTYIQFIFWFLIIPSVFIHKHGVFCGLILCLLPRFVTGVLFNIFSQVTHINELDCIAEKEKEAEAEAEAEAEEAKTHGNTFSSNFIVHQITNAVDYDCENGLVSFLAINLNNQAFHHLVPGIHPCWYPQIAPLFHQFCKDFGIKQNVCQTLFIAQSKRWNHLKKINCTQ